MKSTLLWSDKVQDRDGLSQTISDLSFSPDGTTLLAAAGTQILIYSLGTGDLVQALKAHKETVYGVDYSYDGKRFASAGADKQVIIWNEKFEGILKFSHHEPVVAVSHSPTAGTVVSCSHSDFGIWSPEMKSVTKHKVNSRICSCSWTPDGQQFALGLYNGQISIRVKSGEEKVRVDRSNSSPAWSLSWCPSTEKEEDLLAVGDWGQVLSFYQTSGKQVGKDRVLGYDPCSVNFCPAGEFVLVGGSDRQVHLWTSEGVKLGEICKRDSWVWCCKSRPKRGIAENDEVGQNSEVVAVGTQDGSLALYNITFSTVHALYGDRYAFRENMTDVVIQHLSTDQRARIKCRDHVKNISVYKDRLAVQLPDRVIIYELFHDDSTDMHYRIKEKIQKKIECSLLVVTSNHVILCMEQKLQMFNFSGEVEREWTMEASIRYIKVIGGLQGKEGLLIGLKNGQVLQVFIDNAFPIPIVKISSGIRCLDVSLSRTKLAIVDDQNTLLVHDMTTKELLFQEPNATSVAWNSDFEDMLCYSGNGALFIKTSSFAPNTQNLDGFVVGFKGSKIFCLNKQNQMITIDVPQSTNVEKYLEKKDFCKAYQVSCLGVTESDWKRLAMESLENLQLDISKRAFVRNKDLKYMDIVRGIEKAMEKNKLDSDSFMGDIAAYSGKFTDASKLYRRAGHVLKAVDMYAELHLWEQALGVAAEANMDVSAILKRKAQAQADGDDLMAAAQTFIEVGDYMQAVNILGPNGWMDSLVEVARKLSKAETKALGQCVHYFRKNGNHTYAAEILAKMGDITHLLQLHIELQNWEEAFKIVEMHPEFTGQIYLPYAKWLALNDRFIEAQENYKKAGWLDEAFRLSMTMTRAAVEERRYDDASHYYWVLAKQNLDVIPAQVDHAKLEEPHKVALKNFKLYKSYAELYYAFHIIQRYIDEPFTSHSPMHLFNASRFLLNKSQVQSLPTGISKLYVLYSLSKLCKSLGAYKLARYAYEKLASCQVPPDWQDMVDSGALMIRSKPFLDKDDLLQKCAQCAMPNPLVNPRAGDVCVNCQEPFVRCFGAFETLPLVRFVPEDGLSENEAEKLISADPPVEASMSNSPRGGADTLTLETDNEVFERQLSSFSRSGGSEYEPIKATRSMLLSMQKHEVFVRKWGKRCLPLEYYRLMRSEVYVKQCKECTTFFGEEEWLCQVLKHGECSFCKAKCMDLNQ